MVSSAVEHLWEPDSSIGWIDVDRAEAQRIKEMLGLFKAPEALDPHGILPLQIALSDELFPGVSTQHTRARYIIFAAWHAQRLVEYKGQHSASNWLRHDELTLMNGLLKGDDTVGIFGKRRRENTQTLPSSIYWSALQTWGIVPRQLPLHEVHQAAVVLRSARGTHERSDDDSAAPDRSGDRVIPTEFPPVPETFPNDQSIRMTSDEAEYLIDRIVASARHPFLALVVKKPELASGSFPWSVDPDAGGQPLVDARRFSELIHPARLMYTKLLVEDARQRGWEFDDLAESLNTDFAKWLAEITDEIPKLQKWQSVGLKRLLNDQGIRLSRPRREFIQEAIKITAGDPEGCWDSPWLGTLVRQVERSVKKKHARTRPGPPFERWLKHPSRIAAGRLDYRWGNVQRLVADLEAAK